MAKILVLGVKVPFTHGGQEVLVASLIKKLRERGHEVDQIELPFNPLPKESLLTQAAMWRALDLSEFCGQPIDLVIATKFPSYFARHPRKSVWLVHQLRSIYDLYGGQYSDIGDDPRDETLRRLLNDGDNKVLAECKFISAISKNVAERLAAFNGLSSTVLYPPLPLGDRYRTQAPEPYVLSVGRICRIKRLDLMINALALTPKLSLKVVGVVDDPQAMEYFNNIIKQHGLKSRIELLGRVDDEKLVSLYSKALGVFYAPYNEDYGYVTLEALASSKPVVTAKDSGGTLEFIRDGENGFIVDPTPAAVAAAFNALVADPELSQRLGSAGRRMIESSGMLSAGWDSVIEGLLSPLSAQEATQAAPQAVGA